MIGIIQRYKIIFIFAMGLFLNSPTSSNSSSGEINYKSIEQSYFKELSEASGEIFREEFEFPFLLLLNEQELVVYNDLSNIENRKKFIEEYWNASNPNPLLTHNDWLAEFLRRRKYATENFPFSEPPYIDDRGIYYIKYGKPQRRHEDSGGSRDITFFKKKIPATASNPPRSFGRTYSVIPHEVWSYENIQRNAVIYFLKQGMVFKEIKDLRDVVIDGKSKNYQTSPWLWSDLVKRMAAVSPLFGRAAAESENVEMSILQATAFSQRRRLLTEAYNSSRIIERIDEITTNEKKKSILLMPASAYDPIEAQNKLELYDRVSQFRNPDGTTRIEITILSPIEKNIVKKIKKSSKDTLQIEMAGMLRDQKYNQISRNSTSFKIPLSLVKKKKLPNAIAEFTLKTEPEEAELTLQVKSRKDNRLGFSRRPLGLKDFRGESLMISDIQFFTEFNNSIPTAVLPQTTKEELVLTPYPYLKIRKSQPLVCYFEIYNLKLAQIKREYQVTYKLIKAKKKKSGSKTAPELYKDSRNPSVSFSFNKPVQGNLAQELITIDLSKMSKGPHWLEITVSDPNNNEIVASSERFFVAK